MQVVLILNDLVKFYNINMAGCFEDRDFFIDHNDIMLILDLIFGDCFDCNFFSKLVMGGKFNFTKASFTK